MIIGSQVPQFEILPHLRASRGRPYCQYGPEASQAPARPDMMPLFRDPKYWRARAADAHTMAEHFADPESKRLMLWIANEYEILARRADADLDKLSSKNSN